MKKTLKKTVNKTAKKVVVKSVTAEKIYYDLVDWQGVAPAYVFWQEKKMFGLYFKVAGLEKLADFQAEIKKNFKGSELVKGDGSFWVKAINSGKVDFDFGGTDMENAVWKTLCKIPKGKTMNYTEVAKAAGYPKAVRAVASAVGRNRHSLIIPCHRVIRSDGSLGGYRFGLKLKSKILENEGYKAK